MIAVVTCEALRARAEVVRETWGKDARDIVYVIGRPGGPEELVGDTLYLDCPDDYRHLTAKSFALCRFAHRHLNYDRIFKCDDDTFVNVAALNAAHCPADFFGYVHAENEPPAWRMHKGLVSRGEYHGSWVSGGLGYCLSRRAVSILGQFNQPGIIEREAFEDKAVADALRMSGIVAARLPGQRGDDQLEKAVQGWSFSAHPVPPERMRSVYARMQVCAQERVLTYNLLGSRGRLGNQIWEIASTLGLAAYFRADISLSPDWRPRDMFAVPDEYFSVRPGMDSWKLKFRLSRSQEQYMQDWWYWWPWADRIREVFRPRADVLARLREKHRWFFDIPQSQRLSVHVRRGDYVGDESHYVSLGMGYYREAMSRFSGMTPIVFSDDPAWSAAVFPGCVIAPSVDRAEEHLILMTHCRRHVIANSTFSYWGAVLADSENVIYPDPWFGPAYWYIDLRWSIPPNWTALAPTFC